MMNTTTATNSVREICKCARCEDSVARHAATTYDVDGNVTFIPARTAYYVPEENISKVQDGIARLARRAVKLGSDAPTVSMGAPFAHRYYRDGDTVLTGMHGVQLYVPVHVAGKAPGFNGWTFVATLERLGEANLLRCVPGQTVPESYRTIESRCEHCQTRRARKETFVVRHEDGRHVQVGRQCIRDFLGHASPETIALMAEYLIDLASACGDGEDEGLGYGGRVRYTWTLEEYLANVVAEMRENGWVSRTTSREYDGKPSTADAAGERMDPPKDLNPKPAKPEPADFAKAREVIAYWSALAASSDYEHNAVTIARAEWIKAKHFGIAASLPNSYDRTIAKARLAADKRPSKHFGTIKVRAEYTLTIVKIMELVSDYGVKHLHIMRDEHGNLAKWFSTSKSLDEGATYRVKATVKAHDVWKGEAQTVLLRCDAKKIEPEAAALPLAANS
jgi:hypothetical protein